MFKKFIHFASSGHEYKVDSFGHGLLSLNCSSLYQSINIIQSRNSRNVISNCYNEFH